MLRKIKMKKNQKNLSNMKEIMVVIRIIITPRIIQATKKISNKYVNHNLYLNSLIATMKIK